MEDPINPALASTTTRTASPLHTFLHHPSKKAVLLTSIALAIFVYVIVLISNFSFVIFAVRTNGMRFEVIENGMPAWYQSTLGMIHKVDGPIGFTAAPVKVLEAVPYGAQGEYLVLARVGNSVAIGILHVDNTFENIFSDETPKANLSVRPDGIATFTNMAEGESHIWSVAVTAKHPQPIDLGRGSSPRLFKDGFIVALSGEGIVRIDPAQKTSTVLIPSRNADVYNGAITIDGSRAVISNTSSKSLFYDIHSTSPANISLAATMKGIFMVPVSFVTSAYIVEPTAHNFRFYEQKDGRAVNIGQVSVK